MSVGLKERQERIIQLVQQRGEVPFAEIRNLFPDVSEVTIRRDLETLNHSKQLVRVYGAVKSIRSLVSPQEDEYYIRSASHVKEKDLIARKAIGLLQDNMAIFVDSGTTMVQLCRQIPDRHFIVYTIGISCATQLYHLKNAVCYLLGGQINNTGQCVYGTMTMDVLRNMTFDFAFFGTSGYVPGKGFSSSLPDDYLLRKEVIRHATHSAVLMDSSKYGRSGTFLYARPENVEYLVSDGNLPPVAMKEFVTAGTKVL